MKKVIVGVLVLAGIIFVHSIIDALQSTPSVTSTFTEQPEKESILKIEVLKSYMTSKSHAAYDIRFTNESDEYIKHWSINIEVYGANDNYLGKGQAMVSEIGPASSKVEQVIFLDINVSNISKYAASISGIVGDEGTRIDRRFKLVTE